MPYPGERGQSWVAVELVTNPAAFVIELDTTPPVLSFGRLPLAAPGEEFSLSYTVSEPATIVARLVGDGQTYPVEVSDGLISGTYIEGTYLEVVATDDVNNAQTYTTQVGATSVIDNEDRYPGELLGVEVVHHEDRYEGELLFKQPVKPEPPVPPVFPTPFDRGGYESTVRFHEDRYEGSFLAVERSEDRYVGQFIARDKTRVPATFMAVQHHEERTEATLHLSNRVATIRREDDEILLLM